MASVGPADSEAHSIETKALIVQEDSSECAPAVVNFADRFFSTQLERFR